MVRGAWCVAALLLASGCPQEMANQPRVDVMEPSAYERVAPLTREPVPGSIARGQQWEETPETTGRDGEQPIAKIPVTVDAALLARGRERYNIFCQHCHGPSGAGDGMVVQRGFPVPPSYHTDRLRDLPDGQLFVNITQGIGRMPALGRRISPADRWAIVAYVRALQLSQNTPADKLTEEQRRTLPGVAPAPQAN